MLLLYVVLWLIEYWVYILIVLVPPLVLLGLIAKTGARIAGT